MHFIKITYLLRGGVHHLRSDKKFHQGAYTKPFGKKGSNNGYFTVVEKNVGTKQEPRFLPITTCTKVQYISAHSIALMLGGNYHERMNNLLSGKKLTPHQFKHVIELASDTCADCGHLGFKLEYVQ